MHRHCKRKALPKENLLKENLLKKHHRLLKIIVELYNYIQTFFFYL